MEDGKRKNDSSTIFVGVRLIPEARNLLFELAQLERRSVSKQVEYMIMHQSQKQ